MHQLVQLAGNLQSSSGLPGYINMQIRGYGILPRSCLSLTNTYSWTSFLGFARASIESRSSKPSPRQSLDYPKHPFPTDLTLMLCRIPAGFTEMGLSCKLSVQVLQALRHTAAVMSGAFSQQQSTMDQGQLVLFKSQPFVRIMFLCISVLETRHHNNVEELLVISLLALCISSEALGEHITIGYGYIQTRSMSMWNVNIERECRDICTLGMDDFLLWVKMMLLATFDHDTQTRRTALGLRMDLVLWQIRPDHFGICRQFFWTEALTFSLQRRTARERVLQQPGRTRDG